MQLIEDAIPALFRIVVCDPLIPDTVCEVKLGLPWPTNPLRL